MSHRLKINRHELGYQYDIAIATFCNSGLNYTGCGNKAEQLRILCKDYDACIELISLTSGGKPAMSHIDTWFVYHATVILLPDKDKSALDSVQS